MPKPYKKVYLIPTLWLIDKIRPRLSQSLYRLIHFNRGSSRRISDHQITDFMAWLFVAAQESQGMMRDLITRRLYDTLSIDAYTDIDSMVHRIDLDNILFELMELMDFFKVQFEKMFGLSLSSSPRLLARRVSQDTLYLELHEYA